MTGPRPAVAIVVITYNSADQLDTCLNSLAAGCAGIDLLDVVVADNLSRDATVEVAKQPRAVPVRVVQLGRNAGYAAGINAAIASITAPVDAVLVLNPDITVHPGSVATLARALAARGCAVTVPRLLNPDGSLQPSLRYEPTLGRAAAEAVVGGRLASRLGFGELIVDGRHYTTPTRAAWATGAAMLISTSAAADIGPWDETFLLYGEETEYALRAADRGWEVWFEPASVMDHVGGVQTLTDPRLHALLTMNRVRLYRRRHGTAAAWLYQAVVAAGELARAVGGRRTSRAGLSAVVRRSRRLRELPQ